MSTKMRNLLIIGAMLLISALALSAVSAQDATAEPTAEATEAAPDVATVEGADATQPDATPEAGTTDMNTDTEARPFLGVSLQDSADGVTIAQVVDGSAASAAGLQEGDIITAVNGTSVTTVADTASA